MHGSLETNAVYDVCFTGFLSVIVMALCICRIIDTIRKKEKESGRHSC